MAIFRYLLLFITFTTLLYGASLPQQLAPPLDFQAKMTLLSFIAYCKSNELLGTEAQKSLHIKAAIKQALQAYGEIIGDWELVWGPAVNFKDELFYSDALIYIVREKTSGDCALVVRGTNPFSIWTWINQDLQIGELVSWEQAVSTLPGPPPRLPGESEHKPEQNEKAISLGAYNSLAIHTALKPVIGAPGEGTTFLEFLTATYLPAKGKRQLYFTGHSLGGLMSSTLALWVQDKAPGMQAVNTKVAAIAGLTAGNEYFAAYSNRMLHNKQDKWLIRYANPLDLAVNVWNATSMATLLEIYSPIYPVLQVPGILAAQEFAKDKKYAQVGEVVEVKSKIELLFFEYSLQATYQHVMPYLIDCFGTEQAYQIITYIFELSFKDLLTRN